jgi:hypothetical protein
VQLMAARRWLGLAAGAAILLIAGGADAYPQFQFSTGSSRCNLCHYSPAGGGLINDWGRGVGEDISTFGGDGSVLHGLWEPPRWFRFGGDYRGAGIVKHTAGETDVLAFPMQLDLYTLFSFADFSVAATVGMRGAARDPARSPLSRIISREHYVMWQPRTTGPYVRAGRFFAPFGLRLADHTAYVRRYLGFHTLEETYGVSGGKVERDWELHVTGFVPPPIFGVGEDASGAAAYYERRLGSGALGAQTRVAIGSEQARYIGGAVAKWYFEGPKLLLLSEANLGVQTFAAEGASARGQLTGYLGLTYFAQDGVLLGAALERHDPDLGLRGTGRDAASLTAQWFFRAHWELLLLGKIELVGDSLSDPSRLAMMMLHYYL